MSDFRNKNYGFRKNLNSDDSNLNFILILKLIFVLFWPYTLLNIGCRIQFWRHEPQNAAESSAQVGQRRLRSEFWVHKDGETNRSVTNLLNGLDVTMLLLSFLRDMKVVEQWTMDSYDDGGQAMRNRFSFERFLSAQHIGAVFERYCYFSEKVDPQESVFGCTLHGLHKL